MWGKVGNLGISVAYGILPRELAKASPKTYFGLRNIYKSYKISAGLISEFFIQDI